MNNLSDFKNKPVENKPDLTTVAKKEGEATQKFSAASPEENSAEVIRAVDLEFTVTKEEVRADFDSI